MVEPTSRRGRPALPTFISRRPAPNSGSASMVRLVSSPPAPGSRLLLDLESRHTTEAITKIKLELTQALRAKGGDLEDELYSLSAAFDFIAVFHQNQSLSSGENTILHLLGNARKLAEWGASPSVIAASLLHLVPENELAKASFSDQVITLVARKATLHSYLFIPLKSENFSQQEAQYLAKMCLMEEGEMDVWLLEAADSYVTLFSISESDPDRPIYASRSYQVTPIILRLFRQEAIAMELEDIAALRFNRQEYIRIERLLTEVNQRDRLMAKEYLSDLTALIGIDIERACPGINFRFEYDVKSVVSTEKKIGRGDRLTDPARFRIIANCSPEQLQSITDSLITSMGGFGYSIDWSEAKNYVPEIRLRKECDLGPKTNGYQSVHLHFIAGETEKGRISVQIRTEEMHHQAEVGSAEHGIYFKLVGLSQDVELGDAQTFRAKLIQEGRRYGVFEGEIYRVIPFPEQNRLTLLDLAFSISPISGLNCPENVWLERVDPVTGVLDQLLVSALTPLENGDKIIFDGASAHTADLPRRTRQVASLYAQTVLSLAIRGDLDPASLQERESSAAARGTTLLDALVSSEEAELRAKMNLLLTRDGFPGLQVFTFPLLKLAAGNLGLPNVEALKQAIGITSDRDSILNPLRLFIQTKAPAVAYKLTEDLGVVWLRVHHSLDIIPQLMDMLTTADLGLIQFEMTQLREGYKLLKFRVKPKNSSRKKGEETLPEIERERLKRARQLSLENTLLGQLAKIENLINNVRINPPISQGRQVVFSFSISRLDTKFVRQLNTIFSRPNVEIVAAHLPAVLDGRVICQVTVTVPKMRVDLNIANITRELHGLKLRSIIAS